MLTIKQAAELVGYSIRHLTRLCDEGKIKSERFGWMYAVDEESAKAYAANAPRPGPRGAETVDGEGRDGGGEPMKWI